MSQPKKRGPKGPYAIKKIMDNLSDEQKQELRKKYYLERMTKQKLAKEIGLSRMLLDEFIIKLGPYVAPTND